jgi:abequosyltransferase
MTGQDASVQVSQPTLSICIPTYNFGRFIGATLESIVQQAPDALEILVLDGGSTDDTAAVVSRHAARHRGVRYFRQEHRGGIDRDMARSVELASGDYCWLFSADDIMDAGAIAMVMSELQSREDIYLASFTLATLQMERLRRHPDLDIPEPRSFDLSNPADRTEYFRAARSTVAFFSFMGSLIVRRDKWLSLPLDEAFVGSCWAHVARIFALSRGSLRVRYLASSIILKRADNDSFMDRGAVHRLGIAVDGYNRLADTFFGSNSIEAWHIRRVLRAEYRPYALLYIRQQATETGTGELDRLDRLVKTLYGDASLSSRLRLLAYQLIPMPLFRLGRSVLRTVRLALRSVRA